MTSPSLANLLQSPVATEMDPPAPGACPLPPSAHQLVPSPAPTPSIQSPSISRASSRCWESLKQGWGRGTFTAVPCPPDSWARDPRGEKITGNFPRGFKGRQEHQSCSQISAPDASLPHTRPRGWDGKSPPTPTLEELGGRGRGQEMGRTRGGRRAALSPRRLLQEGPPGTPPRVPPVPREDLSHHRARSPSATPSPEPPRPPHLPTPAPPAGGSGPELAKAEGA